MPGEFGNPSRSPAFRADIWSVIVRYLHVILGSDDMSDMFIGQQLARHDTTGCDQSIPMRCITFRHNSSNCAVQCSTGTYSSSAGSSSCSSCSASQVAPAGATASSQCTTCATGFAPNTAKSACTATSTAIHRKKRAILPCQPGFALCPVLSGRRGVKECVDISSDVESVEAVWAKALARNAPHSILERQQTASAVHVITNAPRATT